MTTTHRAGRTGPAEREPTPPARPLVSETIRQSPEVLAVQAQISRRYCTCVAVAAGALIGVADAWIATLLGYDLYFRGQPAYWHQMAFHVVIFGALGLFAGRAWYRRQQLADAVLIIQRQYEDLKANQQHLIQSEKLAVIGSLSASIAHEIRNPLGVMRSSAQLIADDLPADHPNQKPLEFIRDEIDRLSGLIEGLLVFAKPKQPLLAKADVNALLDRAMAFMAAELRKRRIDVHRSYQEGLPQAYVDADQIHQVFLGLVLNAVQAVREQGTITVGTTLLAGDGEGAAARAAVGAGAGEGEGGPRLRIWVTDTGSGIPEENLEKIFEPFFTTKPEGTGLGLAVARQIISGHGGQIRAHSRPGQGATFSIMLPLAPAALAA
jgi:signal transduction histidine kinase